MKKNEQDVIDVEFQEKEIAEEVSEVSIIYLIAELILRAAMFIVTFAAIGVIWMNWEIYLYDEIYPSLIDTVIGAVIALYVSQKLFSRYCIEEVE